MNLIGDLYFTPIPFYWNKLKYFAGGSLILAGLTGAHAQELRSDDLQDFSRNLDQQALRVDTWFDVPGPEIVNLTSATHYPNRPDRSFLLKGLDDRVKTKSNIRDNYGKRIVGWFRAPLTGEYRFRVIVDDTAQIWMRVGEENTKILDIKRYLPPGKWDHSENQKSKAVHLEQGKAYFMEILMKEGQGGDHLEVGVELPDGRKEFPMRARRFLKPDSGLRFDQDQDDDGLSDYEEWVLGTDPEKSSTAGDDTSDYVKVQLNQNPLIPMSTSFPLPLEWCLRHGIQLKPHVQWADPDGDGLQNQEEAEINGDPNKADTSGDNISDYAISRIFLNPVTEKLDPASWVRIAKIRPDGYAWKRGVWEPGRLEGSYRTASAGGVISYSIPVPKREPMVMRMDVEVMNPGVTESDIWVEMRMGDRPVSRQPLNKKTDRKQNVYFLIPVQQPGWGDVTFVFENPHEERHFLIHDVELFAAGKEQRDWVDTWSAQALTVTKKVDSRISPACLEGKSPYPDFLKAEWNTSGEWKAHEINPLPNMGWYVNAPLPEDGGPAEVKIQQPLADREETIQVRWVTTNLLEEDPPMVRVGDSLRLVAYPADQPEGTMQFRIDGRTYRSTDVSIPFIAEFTEPGPTSVTATWKSNGRVKEKTVEVQVVTAVNHKPMLQKFVLEDKWGETDPPWKGTVRNDTGRVWDMDRRLKLRSYPDETFELSSRRTGRYFIASRAGVGGPVIGVRRFEVLEVYFAKGVFSLSTRLDGVGMTTYGFLVSRNPKGLQISTEIKMDGRTFLDGSKNQTSGVEDIDGCGRLVLSTKTDPQNHHGYFNHENTFTVSEAP